MCIAESYVEGPDGLEFIPFENCTFYKERKKNRKYKGECEYGNDFGVDIFCFCKEAWKAAKEKCHD